MDLHFASAWERVADALPDVDAVVQGSTRLTWRRYDERAARFAGALAELGLQPGAKVALYLYNSPAYLIAQYGSFKLGCTPVNVNYRYLDDELAYLVDNSDSEVVVFHSSLAERVAAVRHQLPGVRTWVSVDDGGDRPDFAVDLDELLAGSPALERRERSPHDRYLLYTGGTTGMPKGVMYDQQDFVAKLYAPFALLDWDVPVPSRLDEVAAFAEHLHATRPMVSVPCCPLMHGTGMWVGAMPAHLIGGTVVLLEARSFDADEVLAAVEREQATRVVIVGDAFARPLLRAIEAADADGRLPDLSSVTEVVSSGAMWSSGVKDGLSRYLDARLVDALGSTEGGGFATRESTSAGGAATASFVLAPDTRFVDEDGNLLGPDDPGPALLASRTSARGYFKDEEKTARTFTEIDGQWYVITGDWATRQPDGTIVLHGRGSNCINTGGEKVYPEEVEEALKRHPDVDDCLVVGLPDDRFGQRIVAVAGRRAGSEPDEEELRSSLRGGLAAYKIPKRIVVVDTVQRAPNGKADYGWAREAAADR